MALSAEQRRVLDTILGVGAQVGATPKMLKAAVETGLVESGLRNLSYGDGSSVGWRQETKSSYPNVNRRDVAAGARRFFAEAKPLRGKVGSAAALAQAVQRSAFPERYGKVAAQADRLIGRLGGSERLGAALTASAPVSSTRSSDNMGGGADALALLQSLGQSTKGPRPSAGLQAPAFSAQPTMPAGGMVPQGGMGQAPQPDITQLLASITTPGGDVAKTTVTGGGATAGGAAPRLKGAIAGSPLAGVKPHKPTHETLGLAGYPAYDYMGKAGTPVVAPVGGKIIKLSGHDPKNGPTQGPHGPFGYSVYVQGDDGRTYYLTHLGSRDVKVGDRVKRGTLLGTIGNYAKWGGANHVHMGVRG